MRHHHGGHAVPRAHRPVQRSVVRSDTSSVSGRSSLSSAATCRLRSSTRYPPVNCTRGPLQGDHAALRGLLVAVLLAGMISTGSWPAAR